MLCDRKLLRWYRTFNRKYWNGELPEDVDIFWSPEADCYAIVKEDDAGWTIQLATKYAIDDRVARMTLLHEMVHIVAGPNHGGKFEEEMIRIAKLGAFRGLW